jgi:hypothetical protein
MFNIVEYQWHMLSCLSLKFMSQIVGNLQTTSKLLMSLESLTLHLPLVVVKPTIISYWWVLSFVEGFCIRLTCLIQALILFLKDHFRVYMLKMDAVCPTIIGFYKKKMSIYLQVLIYYFSWIHHWNEENDVMEM